MPGRYTLRPATAGDGDFIVEMLAEAVNWSERPPLAVPEIMANPELAHYASGWPRPGDLGVIAAAQDGSRIGAAWSRFFDPQHAGYGFVSADVPELAMAVVRDWRGQGVGRALLRGLAHLAARNGIHTLSLSVERANHAARLYRDEGYRVVAQEEDSDTMVKDLGDLTVIR